MAVNSIVGGVCQVAHLPLAGSLTQQTFAGHLLCATLSDFPTEGGVRQTSSVPA